MTLVVMSSLCSGLQPICLLRKSSIFLGRSLDLLWTLWGLVRLRFGLTPAFTCFQSPKWPPKPTTSCQLQGFNPLLKSSSSFWRHSFWCSVLVLAQGLFVGCPPESVLHPDKRGLKQSLSRAYLFSQVRERKGYGRHNSYMQGVPVVA